MAKSMLKTSPGLAERDLLYLQWIVQAVLLNPSLDIVIAKSMHVTPKVQRKGICHAQSTHKLINT